MRSKQEQIQEKNNKIWGDFLLLLLSVYNSSTFENGWM